MDCQVRNIHDKLVTEGNRIVFITTPHNITVSLSDIPTVQQQDNEKIKFHVITAQKMK